MKKLLALAILSTVSLTEPCFGADSNKGKISLSLSGLVFKGRNNLAISPIPAVGYHLTDSIKITVDSIMFPPHIGIFANLYYHHKIENMDVTPYFRVGVGGFNGIDGDVLFSYQIGSGVNFPLSSRTNVFAGYHLLGTDYGSRFDLDHGLEFGININL